MCLVCMRARPLDGCECVCVSTKGSCSLLEVAGIVMNLKVGVRVTGLQTGVWSQPEDRCVFCGQAPSRCACSCPSCALGSRPFALCSRGGER